MIITVPATYKTSCWYSAYIYNLTPQKIYNLTPQCTAPDSSVIRWELGILKVREFA